MPMCVCIQAFTVNTIITCHIRCSNPIGIFLYSYISKKLEYWQPNSPKNIHRTSVTIFRDHQAIKINGIKKWLYEWLEIRKTEWDHTFHLPFNFEYFSKVPKFSCFSCCFIAFSSFSFPNFSLLILWNLAEWLNKDGLKASPPLDSPTSIGTWVAFSDSNFSMWSPSSS